MTHPLDDAEIQLAAIDIDVGHLYSNDVAQPIAIAAAIAGQAVRGAVVAIVVVGQRIDVDQPFGRQLDALREEAEVLDADDDGVHRLADPLCSGRSAA